MNRDLLRAGGLVLLIAAAMAAGCAPKAPPSTAVTAPKFPEFVYPAPGPASPLDIAQQQRDAWNWLQAGELGEAERAWSELLTLAPGTPEALAGLGYLALAEQDAPQALQRFDEALAGQPNMAAALAGRGQALLSMNRLAEAVGAFEAAQRANPSLDYTARIEALRFRGTQQAVAEARAAAAAQRWDEAREKYRHALTASPDSAFLLRELAAVERRAGRTAEALAHLERAIELDPVERAAYVALGELREEGGDIEGAIRAYEAARTLEPGGGIEQRLAALHEKMELSRLPDDFANIEARDAVTRGDVAALMGVRLGDLLTGTGGSVAPLVTDTREHWASDWILGVMRAGVMEPFPNHTFQPDLPMSRGDFAQTVARTLNLIAAEQPAVASGWRSARRTFTDLPPGHPLNPAASMAVAAGILHTGPDGAFEPARPVTGREAIEALDRLRRLAGPARRGALQ